MTLLSSSSSSYGVLSVRPPASATPPCAPAAEPTSERSTKSRKPKPTSPPANAMPISSPNPAPQPSLLILMARKSSLLKQALILVLLLLALFYMPVFSSLSLIVNRGRPPGTDPAYSDEEMREELVKWWEGQEYWKRNNGRDHVIIAQDPNALCRVVDRIKNAVLLVSDFGRLKPDLASLVKYVMLPYSHRINT